MKANSSSTMLQPATMSEMPQNAQTLRAKRQVLLKVACFVLLIIAANLSMDWIVDVLRLQIRPSTEDLAHRLIMISAVAYAFLIAIPFVPGVEIGFTLIGVLGPGIVFLVYMSTLVGLSMSFVIGRLVPLHGLIAFLDDLRLNRASELLRTIQPMRSQERLAYLASKAPNRFIPFLLRHRYVTLAVIINAPGNILIGGGGGIALAAGASRLYSLPGFLLTIALSVSPVPIAILIFGKEILS